MGKPYSLDLRERIIGFVEGGGSRRDAADRFGVSASCAIKLVDRWDRTGSAAPGKRGGNRLLVQLCLADSVQIAWRAAS